MSRLKTLGTYALIVIAFFFFSTFAADVILNNSYNNLSENTDITKSEEGLNVETIEVKANKRQGSFTGKVVNTSSSTVAKKYIRVRAYDGDILLQTRYMTVNDIAPGESREFTTKFTADGIDNYKVDFTDEAPIERTFIDDAIDKVKEFINENKGFKTIDVGEYNIPDWAWVVSAGIVLYAIPSGAIWFII